MSITDALNSGPSSWPNVWVAFDGKEIPAMISETFMNYDSDVIEIRWIADGGISGSAAMSRADWIKAGDKVVLTPTSLIKSMPLNGYLSSSSGYVDSVYNAPSEAKADLSQIEADLAKLPALEPTPAKLVPKSEVQSLANWYLNKKLVPKSEVPSFADWYLKNLSPSLSSGLDLNTDALKVKLSMDSMLEAVKELAPVGEKYAETAAEQAVMKASAHAAEDIWSAMPAIPPQLKAGNTLATIRHLQLNDGSYIEVALSIKATLPTTKKEDAP